MGWTWEQYVLTSCHQSVFPAHAAKFTRHSTRSFLAAACCIDTWSCRKKRGSLARSLSPALYLCKRDLRNLIWMICPSRLPRFGILMLLQGRETPKLYQANLADCITLVKGHV